VPISWDKESANRPEADEVAAYVCFSTVAILSAVAALESTINEFFLDAVHGTLKGISQKGIDALKDTWPNLEPPKAQKGRKFASTLQKYQAALKELSKEKFSEDAKPFSTAGYVIKLRNALVHYKPEWSYEQAEHSELTQKLEGQFAPNPFQPRNQVFFPHRCIVILG
jgi:hypothetical protein